MRDGVVVIDMATADPGSGAGTGAQEAHTPVNDNKEAVALAWHDHAQKQGGGRGIGNQ